MEQERRRYPIGIQTFEKIRKEGFVYVDKTAVIYDLVSVNSIYFLSRPRRFGKSLLVSTLDAYFSGRKELFEGLAIAGLEKDWVEYPVLHFDFSGTKYFSLEDLEGQFRIQLTEWERLYGSDPLEKTPAERMQGIIRRAYAITGRQVVFLVDEYDAPLLDSADNPQLQARLRNMLRSFYNVIKKNDPYLRFVFITGVTKYSQMSIFSELNSLQNISMKDCFSAICGITADELASQLHHDVEVLARENGETYEEAAMHLKHLYDGYHFSPHSEDIYNPFSLLNAFNDRRYERYWFSTGTPSFLIDLLDRSELDVESLESGIRAAAEDFDVPIEQIKDPLPLMYQSGYLTIKDYDPEYMEYTLAYSNEEVRLGFIGSLLPNYTGSSGISSNSLVVGLVKALRRNDIQDCMERLTAYFASIPYTLNNKEEKHYHTIFYLLFSMMGQYVESEVRSAVGRADAVIRTESHIYVFEFKLDGSADEALEQIDRKGYLVPYAADGRKLVKIGVNFDSSTRTVGSWRAVEV